LKKILLVLLLITIALSVYSTELNNFASYLKENYNEQYENIIKKHAELKWGDDFSMVLYEINKQSESYITIFKNLEKDQIEILLKCIIKWSHKGYKSFNIDLMNNGAKSPLDFHCDWPMVLYELEKQVNAKNSY
jgi:hypothetical protein